MFTSGMAMNSILPDFEWVLLGGALHTFFADTYSEWDDFVTFNMDIFSHKGNKI